MSAFVNDLSQRIKRLTFRIDAFELCKVFHSVRVFELLFNTSFYEKKGHQILTRSGTDLPPSQFDKSEKSGLDSGRCKKKLTL